MNLLLNGSASIAIVFSLFFGSVPSALAEDCPSKSYTCPSGQYDSTCRCNG